MDEIEKRMDKMELRVSLLERDFKELYNKLDKIDSNLSRVLWVVITAVLLALLNTVIKGGILS